MLRDNMSNASSNSSDRIKQVSEITLVTIIALATFFGNGIIMVLSIFKIRNKSGVHWVILNIAACDMLMSIVYMPSVVYGLWTDTWMLDDLLCTPIVYSLYTLTGVVAMNTLIIGTSRLATCVKGAKYNHVFLPRRTVFYIVMTWFVCAIGFLVIFISGAETEYNQHLRICSFHKSMNVFVLNVLNRVVMLMVFLFPMCLNAICYVIIYLRVPRVFNKGVRQRKQEVLTSTLIITVSLCVCWLPFIVLHLFDPLNMEMQPLISRIVLYLRLLYSALGPFIYGFRLAEYKSALYNLLGMSRSKSVISSIYVIEFKEMEEEFKNRSHDIHSCQARP